MGFLEGWAISSVTAWLVGTGLTWLIGWILKQIPNEKIKAFFGRFAYGLGVSVTLGLSKWSFTKKFWNKVIEPWFIDLIDNVIGEMVKQFILGLRSDN
jgi:hypothetical protein